jgi:hypothetical protein
METRQQQSVPRLARGLGWFNIGLGRSEGASDGERKNL